ncbi:hypothetical protein ACFC01_08390 [Streptomyces mirabilis]|uniref:hypothetical protein n=1 Tax=Streptomyces mirabilis TaxID=68239 RepID=UPI0035D667A8
MRADCSRPRRADHSNTNGPAPIGVLELGKKTPMRYADSARTLLEQAAEADPR